MTSLSTPGLALGFLVGLMVSLACAIGWWLFASRRRPVVPAGSATVEAPAPTHAEALEALVTDLYARVMRGDSLSEALTEVCRRLLDFPCVVGAWVATRLADGALAVIAAAGEAGPGREAACAAGGLAAEAVRTGHPQTIEAGPSRGWLTAVPLAVAGEAIGALVLVGGPAARALPPNRLAFFGLRLGLAVQLAADQKQMRLQGAAMAAAANAIFITDPEGRIEWANAAFTRLSGYSLEEAIGRTPQLLRSGAQAPVVYEDLWNTIRAGRVWRGEMVERRKDGALYTVDQTITPMLDARGEVVHYVVVHEDITERKRAEERIRFLSNYDPLTALPNRALFQHRLRQAIDRAAAEATSLAVLFVDLDHFSRVNDSMGHDVGDRLLTAIVERLTAAVRSAHTIARVGGDEFAVIEAGLIESQHAANLACRITTALAQPFDIDGHELHIGASVGIALYPDDGDDVETLVKNADIAMYRAIHEAPNGYRFFSSHMNAEMRTRLVLERDLRRALGKRQFALHYQPQIDAATGRIVALEALLRWYHPEFGLVPPDRFIPLAEAGGAILPIGEWVLREACRQLRSWQAAGLETVPVAVNLSAAQLRQPGLIDRLRRILDEAGLDPRFVEIELTESVVMQDGETAVGILQQISHAGFTLAIDDFGTGYSSLNYLKRFPVDKLKIDKSFVADLTTDPSDAEIARAIITLGHSLGLKVVSEGVETPEQLEYLRGQGCDVVQGYLFSRPVPAEEAGDMMRSRPFERAAE